MLFQEARNHENQMPAARRAASHPGFQNPPCDTSHPTGLRDMQDIHQETDRVSEDKCGSQNLNRKWLSPVMRLILVHVRNGIERGALVERIYGLERRYCGYDADSCLRGKEKTDYKRRYRRAQPVLSRSLKRLEQRGLVNLTRHGRYIKGVVLTDKGKALADELREDDRREGEVEHRAGL